MLWIIYTIRLGENAWIGSVSIETTNCSIPIWIVLLSNCLTPLIVYVVLRLNTHEDGITSHTNCDEDQAIGLENVANNQILNCLHQFLKLEKQIWIRYMFRIKNDSGEKNEIKVNQVPWGQI